LNPKTVKFFKYILGKKETRKPGKSKAKNHIILWLGLKKAPLMGFLACFGDIFGLLDAPSRFLAANGFDYEHTAL
jgi:hypothetical protein